jgi:hypothetical protein
VDRDTLLVVVGAGASFACLPDDVVGNVSSEGLPELPWPAVRPPLTQTLVGPGPLQDEVLARYSSAKPLVAELRSALAEAGDSVLSFEALLAEYERSAATNPARDRHLVALRFYLRDLLWACTDYATQPRPGSGLTRYHRMVNELQDWAVRNDRHVCFVNFNYDLILERACADDFGLDPDSLDDYLANPHVSVTKPHGSVNWAWRLGGQPSYDPDADVIAHAGPEVLVRRGTLHVDPIPPHARGPRGLRDRTVPALALPVTDKNTFVWPAAQHAFVAEGLHGRVRGVITLGWRGLEPHFLALLPPLVRSGARMLLVMGGTQGERNGADLETALRAELEQTYVEYAIDVTGVPASLRASLDWLDGGFRSSAAGT